MKKPLALLMVLVLAVSFLLTAQAEGFDLSVFEDADNIEITEDEETGDIYISLEDLSPCFFDPGDSEDYYCYFYPAIFYNSEDDYSVFLLFCEFFAENWPFVDKITVNIGGSCHAFFGACLERTEMDNGDMLEELGIVIEPDYLCMMEEMRTHSSKWIRIRLKGDKRSYNFAMTDAMRESILAMYELYEEVGGTSAENMRKISE